MYSYIAISWEAADRQPEPLRDVARLRQCLQDRDHFSIVLDSPGLLILQRAGRHSACGATLLPNSGGAVLGTLFSSPTCNEVCARVVELGSEDSRKIVDSGGEHLVTHFWGRYVAVLRHPRTNRVRVLRDPSGMLPCFHTKHGMLDVWFSKLEDLSAFRRRPLEINWIYLERHLVFGHTRSPETGLIGVREILNGELCEVDRNGLRCRTVWNPATICTTSVLEDPTDAAQRLRSITKSVIEAWASAYGGILHLLSGGLDSSIVAVLLGQARSRNAVTCLNYFTSEPEGDERNLARLAAQQAGFDLIETLRTPRSVDMSAVLNVYATPAPLQYSYPLEHEQFEYQQVDRLCATAICTGSGGEGVFYCGYLGHLTADYLSRHGLSRSALAVALNEARLEGRLFFEAIKDALSEHWWRRRRRSAQRHIQEGSLLSPALTPTRNALLFAHGESAARVDVPLGKALQIRMTSIPPAFYNQLPNAHAVERVHPFLSQPIVEHCLRIPTYVLNQNGWDRAVARKAFALDLPRQVAIRRGKGSLRLNEFAKFAQNRLFVRNLMLGGELSRRGYLRKRELERTFALTVPIEDMTFMEVLKLMSTEAWVQRIRALP